MSKKKSKSNIKKYYFSFECDICKYCHNKSDNEKKFISTLKSITSDKNIMTFTYNLKKNNIIKNYNRCKHSNCTNFINDKQFYFEIYMLWLYYLKNKDTDNKFEFYSRKIRILSNITRELQKENKKNKRKLNCCKAVVNLDSLALHISKNRCG